MLDSSVADEGVLVSVIGCIQPIFLLEKIIKPDTTSQFSNSSYITFVRESYE